MSATKIKRELKQLANSEKGAFMQGFFKTHKGGYGEGDKFLGITVPAQRAIAKKYTHTSLADIAKLLDSNWHEHRLTALAILVYQYSATYTKKEKDTKKQREIYTFYIAHRSRVNNWDLVDMSAYQIAGHYMYTHPTEKKKLYTYAKSKNLWDRRIAMVACYYFIKQEEYDDALAIAKILVHDSEDLMHKAVGWMLREIGKRDKRAETMFLDTHYKTMPRTMLRYAIEKFPQHEREYYMKK